MNIDVRIQSAPFESQAEYRVLAGLSDNVGAVVCFTGIVRKESDHSPIQAMLIEHYPAMTKASIAAIIRESALIWPVLGARVVHRAGRLLPGEEIVWVGVSACHRSDAFEAAEFIMDYLKIKAPFWKKMITAQGEHWIEAKDSDKKAAQRWHDHNLT